MIDKLYDIIGNNLNLIQENVPETIKELRAAGIKIGF